MTVPQKLSEKLRIRCVELHLSVYDGMLANEARKLEEKLAAAEARAQDNETLYSEMGIAFDDLKREYEELKGRLAAAETQRKAIVSEFDKFCAEKCTRGDCDDCPVCEVDTILGLGLALGGGEEAKKP